MKDQSIYKGRKGRKLPLEINSRADQLKSTVDPLYADSKELAFIEEYLKDPLDRLHFMEVFRDLDQMWNGILNYGFLRLCVKWLRVRKPETLTGAEADLMLRDILTSEEYNKIGGRMTGSQEERGAK